MSFAVYLRSAVCTLLCIACLLVGFTVSAGAVEPQPPDEPKPMAPAQNAKTDLEVPKSLQKYTRSQRVAVAGIPIYLGGLSMAGWGAYQIGVNNGGGNLVVPIMITGSGAILAMGGANMIAFGSHSAAMSLVDNPLRRGDVVAARVAYGMLAVGSTVFLIEYFFARWLGVPGLMGGGAGMGAAILSAVPGMIQIVKNPRLYERHVGPTVSVLPVTQGAGLAMAFRY